MRRNNTWILALIIVLSLVGCGKTKKHEIEILIPAGSRESFVYSEAEIRPIGDKITIWSGAGLGDTEVILHPVDENVETGYVGEYLTHGVPVKFDTVNVMQKAPKFNNKEHDEVEVNVIGVTNELTVEISMLKPNEVPYREFESFGIEEYKIVDANKMIGGKKADHPLVLSGSRECEFSY